MRCDEIRERFIDLLYDERGTPSASPELRAHLHSCPSCRGELEELKGAQTALRLWQDEPPLRPVSLPAGRPPRFARWEAVWPITRRLALAAAVLLAFLALANAEISWEPGHFSFKTRLFSGVSPGPQYYTRSETRDLVRRALDDAESRMMDTSYLMTQRMLDTVEQERWSDLRLLGVRHTDGRARN